MNLSKLANKNVDHWLMATLNLILLLALPAILMYFAYANEYIKVQNEAIEIRKEVHLIKEAKAKSPEEMTTEEYICYKFGSDCKMAVAVSQAENGTRQCDRIVIEPNNTVSVGLFQVNSIHFKKYPLSQLITCHGNVDAAKEIYDTWGSWQPWSVYKNGSYKRFLKEPSL